MRPRNEATGELVFTLGTSHCYNVISRNILHEAVTTRFLARVPLRAVTIALPCEPQDQGNVVR